MKKYGIPLRLGSLFLSFLILFCAGAVVSFAKAETPSMEEANAVWLYHLEGDRLVLSKNETLNFSAGTTVKLMAGLLFCELLESRLSEDVVLTPEMAEYAAGRSLKLKSGDVVQVRQLMNAAICSSYNDAFYILGIYAAGSVKEFLSLMNQRAAELGATQTTYTDLTGLQSGSRTSASDLAKIASAAYRNSLFMELSDQKSFTFSSAQIGEKDCYNYNALISPKELTKYYNESCHGMSAGLTTDGGNSVITVSEKNGESYLCIVLGGIDSDEVPYGGYTVVNRLLRWVYSTYSYMEVLSPESKICTVPVTVCDMVTEMEVRTDETLSAYLPAGVEVGKEITYSIRLIYTELEAPVTKGTMVGYVAVIYEDRVLGTAKLYTTQDAERSPIAGSMKAIQALTRNRALMAGVIFFLVSLFLWVLVSWIAARRRRHKWDKYFSDKVEMLPGKSGKSKCEGKRGFRL